MLRTIGSCGEGSETSSDTTTIRFRGGMSYHMISKTLESSVASSTTWNRTWMSCFRYVGPHMIDKRKEVFEWVSTTTTSLPTTDIRRIFGSMGSTGMIVEFQ